MSRLIKLSISYDCLVAANTFFFFFNDPAPTEISTFPLHDALPICVRRDAGPPCGAAGCDTDRRHRRGAVMNGASALADVVLHHGNVTTLDRSNPTATAVAIRDEIGRAHV